MQVFRLNNSNINIVSKFMSALRPEWWGVQDAESQLKSGIGWYLGLSEDQPKGWVLCKSYDCYRTVEIECLGFDDDGIFKIDRELQALIEVAEDWARDKGYTLMRFIIGSRGISCHGKELKKTWEELRDLQSVDRPEYDWFLSMGYNASGILPNIYGKGNHGIMLIKEISALH